MRGLSILKTFEPNTVGLGLFFESVSDFSSHYVTVQTRDVWRCNEALEGRMQLTAAEAIELAGVLVRAVYGDPEPDADTEALHTIKHELGACTCKEGY